MPTLRELYLSENRIKSFVGLEGCGSLQVLHLRRNNIDIPTEEDIFQSESIEYLNLRENRVDKLEDIRKIKSNFPKLKTIIVSFNAIVQKYQERLYYEMINIMPQLNRINKIHITLNIRKKAYEYAEARHMKELEEKRTAIRIAKEKERAALEAEARDNDRE
eukprot:TRINITY_DN7492_c0_g1_i1.p1 TRINITY_DN7492_c0_g1~~TRINITY_DN7492_c0_g1_i1.p1  ORF type:complete len:162 (-),score=45.21 TRINITY_DN7492_c0_g1_i1:108-593(-)